MNTPCGCTEEGSISVFYATVAFALIILAGLAVDVGGQVQAQQQARDVAAQAARAGGQQIDEAIAIQGDGAVVHASTARAAAQNYLHRAGYTGTTSIVGNSKIAVTTSTKYRTKLLGIIGINSLPASGKATARLVRVVEGTER